MARRRPKRPSRIKLEWKRGKRADTDMSKRMIWASRCGRYQVMESISNYSLPTSYYAMRETLSSVISTHKTRKAAERACDDHDNTNSRT